VEVEVERLEQIEEAIAAGAGMILLDNFAPAGVEEAISRIRGRVPVDPVTLANEDMDLPRLSGALNV